MRLTPTLAALAVCGLAANAQAVSIKDDVVSLGVGVRLQTRVTVADATDVDGDEFNVQNAVANADLNNTGNDAFDFQIRRARLYLNIKYGENWKGQVAWNADNIADNAGGRRVNDDAAQIRYAFLEYGTKLNEDFRWGIHFGLDKPFFNDAEYISSSSLLFPTRRGLAETFFGGQREIGIGLRLYHPFFNFGVDVQTNGQNADGAYRESPTSTVRIEFTPLVDGMPEKRAESYAGKEGTHLVIGVDYGLHDNFDSNAGANQANGVGINVNRETLYGVDLLFHWNQLTLIADAHFDTKYSQPNNEIEGHVFSLQAGWAFPMENGWVIEPAIRYEEIDENDDLDQAVNYAVAGDDETGNSGTAIELGVNCYFSGHSNKLQLQLVLWEAEEGEGDATIVRLQHQLNF